MLLITFGNLPHAYIKGDTLDDCFHFHATLPVKYLPHHICSCHTCAVGQHYSSLSPKKIQPAEAWGDVVESTVFHTPYHANTDPPYTQKYLVNFNHRTHDNFISIKLATLGQLNPAC